MCSFGVLLMDPAVNPRLIYVVGQLGAGGLERQLFFLLQKMNRDRYRPEVVVWNFDEDDAYVTPLRKLGLPLRTFPASYSRIQKLSALRQIVREKQPEVIHSYTFFTNFAAWWAAFGLGPVVVGSVRSNFDYDRISCGPLLGRLSARWPETLIFNSLTGAEEASNSVSFFAPRRRIVVKNGLDLSFFRGSPVRMDGVTRIVGVGSLLSVKRWERLVKACIDLKIAGHDFRVDLVGDGPLRTDLKRSVCEAKLEQQFSISGRTNRIPEILEQSTLLAHTSDVEGCPNVVMEAMACGRPVVATDAGDIPTLVEDGKTGFVVRRGDDGELVRKLATLIQNRELCQTMGHNAREKAENEFGVDRLVGETFAAYRAAGWIGS